MGLKEFFKEFKLSEIIDMYLTRVQDDAALDILREIIMERLNITDRESFELWLELY